MIEIGSTLSGLDRAININSNSTNIIFVGMNPSVKGTSAGSTFNRLNEWVEQLGLTEYGFVNAYPHPGKCKVSQVNLDNLRALVYKASKVVALGNFAAEALEKAGIDCFKLPHPSPLNRQINDKVFISEQLEKCRNYINNSNT